MSSLALSGHGLVHCICPLWGQPDITKFFAPKILSGCVAPVCASSFGGWQGVGSGYPWVAYSPAAVVLLTDMLVL
jgi:hypothetical protein